MYKRNWIIAATLGLVFLGQLSQAQQQTQGAQESTTEQETQPTDLPNPFPVIIVESDESADARERSEREGQEREKKDLIAQERMADATEAMNEATQSMKNAAWLSFGAVALGTVLLIWTLFLTRQANKAAQSSVEAVQDATFHELRPWIMPQKPEIEERKEFRISKSGEVVDVAYVFSIGWLNGGANPAIDVEVYAAIHTAQRGSKPPIFGEEDGFSDKFYLAANGTANSGDAVIHGPDIDQFLFGKLDVYLHSRIQYKSVHRPKEVLWSEATYRIYQDGEFRVPGGAGRPNIVWQMKGQQAIK